MADSKNANLGTEFEALLDANLEDLADAPEFAPFLNGLHEVKITFETKIVNKHPSVSVGLELIQTIELAEKDVEPQKTGSQTNILCMLDNEMGQGTLKKILGPLKAHFNTTTNRETMEKAQNAVVKIITVQRPNKDKTSMYTNLVELVV